MITAPRMITPTGKWPHVVTRPHHPFIQLQKRLQAIQSNESLIHPIQMNNIGLGNGFPSRYIHTGFAMTKSKSNRFITFKSQKIQFFQCMQSKSPFAFKPIARPQMKIALATLKHPMLTVYPGQLIQGHTQSLGSHKRTTCRRCIQMYHLQRFAIPDFAVHFNANGFNLYLCDITTLFQTINPCRWHFLLSFSNSSIKARPPPMPSSSISHH